MRIGKTPGTKFIVKSYPGLDGASVGSIVKLTLKAAFNGSLMSKLRDQKTLDNLLTDSLNGLKFGKSGVIVQVGANDGQHSDPLRDIIKGGNVKAVLVEPMPIAFKALSKLYKKSESVQLVNSAISASGGKLVLYTPQMKGSELQSTLWTTTSKEQALREVERIMGRKALKTTRIKEHVIKSMSATQLCKKQKLGPKDVKALVCDTEGQDAKIIGSFLDAKCRPKVIFYEKLHVAGEEVAALNSRLESLGYTLRQSNKDVCALK